MRLFPVRGKNAAAYCRGLRPVRRGMPEAMQDKMSGACVPLKVCVMDAETSAEKAEDVE